MGFADTLLDKMQSTPSFPPAAIETFHNWAMEAGDIISVVVSGETKRIPIFNEDMTWTGAAQASISCTGNLKREVLEREQRESFATANAFSGQIEEEADKLYKLRQGLETSLSFQEAEDGTLTSALIQSAVVSAIEEQVVDPTTGETKTVLTDAILNLLAVKNEDGSYTSLSQIMSTANDAKAGLENKVTVDNGKKTASAIMAAAVGDAVSTVETKAWDDGQGNTKSLAQIVADVISLNGRVDLTGILTVDGNGISSNGPITTTARVYTNNLTVSSGTITLGASETSSPGSLSLSNLNGIVVNGNTYNPTNITSTDGRTHSVLGA